MYPYVLGICLCQSLLHMKTVMCVFILLYARLFEFSRFTFEVLCSDMMIGRNTSPKTYNTSVILSSKSHGLTLSAKLLRSQSSPSTRTLTTRNSWESPCETKLNVDTSWHIHLYIYPCVLVWAKQQNMPNFHRSTSIEQSMQSHWLTLAPKQPRCQTNPFTT